MAQYKATDDSIFALGAGGGVIVSKVPKHGADQIRISRLGKDGKLVLKDQAGEALLSAFGKSTYRWDGTTPLTNVIQKHSFATRGFDSGQTDTGSKTTHRNISVTGSDDWQPVPQGPSPVKRSPFAQSGGAAKLGRLQKKFDMLQKEIEEVRSGEAVKAKAAKAAQVAKAAKAKAAQVAKAAKAAKAKGKGKATATSTSLSDQLHKMLGGMQAKRKRNSSPTTSAEKKRKIDTGSATEDSEEDSEEA